MKKILLGMLFAFLPQLGSQLCADVAYLGRNENGKFKLDQSQTDYVRDNLIHIFDSSNFHQMPG